MSRINFNKLYYFYIVAQEGSIKAASEKLHLTQPTISVQIKSLEEEIGFEVFTREHKKLILTTKGQVLLQHADKLFLLADEIVSELPKMGLRQKEEFKVGSLYTLSSVYISDFFVNLWEDNLVTTTITKGHKVSLLYGLDNAQYDFILTDESYGQSHRYTSINLGSDRLIAVAAQKFRPKTELYPHCLNNIPYLSFLNDGRTQIEISYYLNRHNIAPPRIGAIDDVTLMKRVTERGLCFSILPYRAVKDSLDSGTLIQLGELNDVSFNLWGVFPTMSLNRSIIKKVINQYFKPLSSIEQTS